MRKILMISCVLLFAGFSQAALVGQWTFNDGTAADISGNGFDGAVTGAAMVATPGGGYGLQFDVITDQVLYPVIVNDAVHAGPANYSNRIYTYTIEAWINISEGAIMAQSGVNHGLFGGGNPFEFIGANDNIGLGVTAPLTANQWHHVVFAYDGQNYNENYASTSYMYVDGVLTTTAANGFRWYQATPYQTGGDVVGSPVGFLNGIVDEIRIYDNALTAEDVAASYAAGPVVVPEPATMVLIMAGMGIVASRKK